MPQEVYWQDFASSMLVPCLNLTKNAPKNADSSRRDGYIWYWQRPEGWLFKDNDALEAWWSDPMTYVEAAKSVRERINPIADVSTTFPSVLVIHTPAPFHDSRVKVALFRVGKGYLEQFSTTPPSWYKDGPSSWDRLADPLV